MKLSMNQEERDFIARNYKKIKSLIVHPEKRSYGLENGLIIDILTKYETVSWVDLEYYFDIMNLGNLYIFECKEFTDVMPII